MHPNDGAPGKEACEIFKVKIIIQRSSQVPKTYEEISAYCQEPSNQARCQDKRRWFNQ